MRKLLMLMFASFMTAFIFNGCDNKKVEQSWNTAKKVHAVGEVVGAAVIEAGVIKGEKAEKLKKINKTVKGAGGTVEKVYKKVKPQKDMDVPTSSASD